MQFKNQVLFHFTIGDVCVGSVRLFLICFLSEVCESRVDVP